MDSAIRKSLSEKLGVIEIKSSTGIGGGCISNAMRVITDKGSFFVKYNGTINVRDFQTEAKALNLMASTNTVMVPKAHDYGVLSVGKGGFLICDHLEMHSMDRASQKALGRQLAEMHLASSDLLSNEHNGKFGLGFDNSCGNTPQINSQMDNWVEFYKLNRIRFQCERIHATFGDGRLMELERKLESEIVGLFEGAGSITPCLIHGDLWSGNAAQVDSGVPCIFDPAAYFAHAEAEIGMMKLFGGFSRECFTEYHKIIPKSPGFEERNRLYQLYHVLNHYNIFGQGYRSQALSLLESLV